MIDLFNSWQEVLDVLTVIGFAVTIVAGFIALLYGAFRSLFRRG